MTKRACYVCSIYNAGVGEGCLRFLKNITKLKEWMESIGLEEIPPEHARIGSGHFLPHEIESTVDGRRYVNPLALPLKV